MRLIVVLSSFVAVMLSQSLLDAQELGAQETVPSPIEVIGTPPPLLPPPGPAPRGEAPRCDHVHGECVDPSHSREPALGQFGGQYDSQRGRPVERVAPTADLAYDASTDSIIVYFPDGTSIRRPLSELRSPRPSLPFRGPPLAATGPDRRFACDRAHCRFPNDAPQRCGVGECGYTSAGSHYPSWRNPSPGYGCQGGACSLGDSTGRSVPNAYDPAAYRAGRYGPAANDGYYRP